MAARSPAPGRGLLERFGRDVQLPRPEPAPQRWPTGAAYGSYTHFCSNACAAWSNAALDAIGGFQPTLVSEETIAVAELLARGERIAYVAEAIGQHAHRLDLAGASAASSTSATAAASTTGCCSRARATAGAGGGSPRAVLRRRLPRAARGRCPDPGTSSRLELARLPHRPARAIACRWRWLAA